MTAEPTAPLVLAGVLVGLLVGLTGMGGGALLTPLLVLGFGMPPLTAVSSDLVTSLVMKPVGAAVHLRAGTVDWLLVRRLCLGAVPMAFGSVLVLGAVGAGAAVQEHLRVVTGGVLLASLAAMAASRLLRQAPATTRPAAPAWSTVAVGAVGGTCVGLTSVGAGSVILALLLATQPALRANRLVGTDLVQAVPVVAAAALGHAIFGDVRLSVAAALVVGAVPATYVGARLSARAPVGVLRGAVVVLVWTSALALVRVPPVAALVVTGLLVLGWWASRRLMTFVMPRS
ncbi:sulfite exporter TauE/SafE family protein [Angustibacter sp. Root456]|uniref:sulfite exporter TauE/SafE family protein n=1 Tax=Angustibacter sp. Root456 TaxID=1736539 RepID=UPI000A88ABC0|nr:sulfite exporter TauE/SafE family protein [Angustibacter sp. Root456]